MSFEFARSVERPGAGAAGKLGRVRISPRGDLLAFTVAEGGGRGEALCVSPPGGARRLLAAGGDHRRMQLAFSPDGTRVAYVLRGSAPGAASKGIAWVGVGGERGASGEASAHASGSASAETREGALSPGLSFSWMPQGEGLIIADPANQRVYEKPLDGPSRSLARVVSDADPQWAPAVAVSADGSRIAFTTRSVRRKISAIWYVDRRASRETAELLTEVPGASVRIQPFWSPSGDTLGLLMVHLEQQKSAIVLLPDLEADGDIVYESGLLDLPERPTFSPSGQHVFFFRTIKPSHKFTSAGPPSLFSLHCASGRLAALTTPGDVEGTPHFLDGRTLAVDATGEVHLFRMGSEP